MRVRAVAAALLNGLRWPLLCGATRRSRACGAAQLLEETLEVVRPKASDKSLDLQLTIDESLNNLHLMGDTKRIEQVVLNLLWNALKFTNEGYVRLSGRIAGREADAVHVLFEVADSGVGIAPEDQ